MSGSNQTTARCKHCGTELEVDHQGPCPECGEVGKEIIVAIGTAVETSEAGSVSWLKVREYYERKPRALIVWAVITIGAPFIGLVLAGWFGVIAGLIVALINSALEFHAITKIRDGDNLECVTRAMLSQLSLSTSIALMNCDNCDAQLNAQGSHREKR